MHRFCFKGMGQTDGGTDGRTDERRRLMPPHLGGGHNNNTKAFDCRRMMAW